MYRDAFPSLMKLQSTRVIFIARWFLFALADALEDPIFYFLKCVFYT